MNLCERLEKITYDDLSFEQSSEWRDNFKECRELIKQKLLNAAKNKCHSIVILITNKKYEPKKIYTYTERIIKVEILKMITNNDYYSDINIIQEIIAWLKDENINMKITMERNNKYHSFYLDLNWKRKKSF